MEFFVYILYSNNLSRYYVGHTGDVLKRLDEHNSGKGNYTAKGMPWQLVITFSCATRADAIRLELQIKKRGISRYLIDNGLLPAKSGS